MYTVTAYRETLAALGKCDPYALAEAGPDWRRRRSRFSFFMTACSPARAGRWLSAGARPCMVQDTLLRNTTAEEARIIIGLRLLIARAASPDSLAWWEDESLTPHAAFLLERLFPTAPALAARNLALRAALARHQAACARYEGARHLYRLDADNADALAFRREPLLPIPVPEAPISTMDELREHLLGRTGRPLPCSIVRRTEGGGLQIAVPPAPYDASAWVHRASTLAWAYLEGGPAEPVFPYCLPAPEG